MRRYRDYGRDGPHSETGVVGVVESYIRAPDWCG